MLSFRKALALCTAALTVTAAAVVSVPSSPVEAPVALAASVDYFLKIEGVDGESSDDRNKGSIEIQSWSWGATNPGISMSGASGGGGGGAGKVSIQDFHFKKSVDKSSPIIMLMAATGEHIKKATLTVRKAGSKQNEFYKVTLEDVLISSYAANGDQGSVPMDSFSLNFAKITVEYTPTKADGSAGSPVKAGYDVKANKKI